MRYVAYSKLSLRPLGTVEAVNSYAALDLAHMLWSDVETCISCTAKTIPEQIADRIESDRTFAFQTRRAA